MTDQLDRARAALNALTPDELTAIRDEASTLIDYYQTTGGLLIGGGYLEVKRIPFTFKTTDEDGNITIGKDTRPYCYVRRAQIDQRGKVTTKTVGYYGAAGVEVMAAGRGDELLAAHIAGGENAGDIWLADNGYEPPSRRGRDKPPAVRPVHPLNDEAITAQALDQSPIYRYFVASCPIPAGELLAAVKRFETDLDQYSRANERGLRYRLGPGEIDQRRAARKRKADTGRRSVRRRRGKR